jgi:hypothetical protein
MPVLIILLLKYKRELYPFQFIFHIRESVKDFALKYPADQQPPVNSIEIEVINLPEWMKGGEHDTLHIATNKAWHPDEEYICHYPAKDPSEALEIAKYWAKYNLRRKITGNTSKEKAEVDSFKLDGEIMVFEIK